MSHNWLHLPDCKVLHEMNWYANYLDIFLWAAPFSVEGILHHCSPVQMHAANASQDVSPAAWSDELPAQSIPCSLPSGCIIVSCGESQQAHVSIACLVVCKELGS